MIYQIIKFLRDVARGDEAHLKLSWEFTWLEVALILSIVGFAVYLLWRR